MLYGTKKLRLVNALMPKTYGQIRKMVSQQSYIVMMSEIEQDELQEQLETMYSYDYLTMSERLSVREVPLITDFDELVKLRVERLNKWIRENLE